METKELIEKFKKYLKRKNSTNETIRNYMYDLNSFSIYVDKNLEDVTEEDIKKFIQEKKDKNISANRINFSISVLISFYKYLNKNNFIKNNPMKNISRLKTPKKKETFLTIDEIKKIRKGLNEIGDIQLEAFFGILCCSCPNKSNISKIEWRKINWKMKYIEVIIDDNTRSILYLDDYTLDKLIKLRKERHNKGLKRKHVFITKYKGWSPVKNNTINYWMKKLAELGGVDTLTFGIMKNTCKNYLCQMCKMSDSQIKKIFSWRNFEIEFRYLMLDEVENFLK